MIFLIIVNYLALGLLFVGLFYMHYCQKLNWFVYFCFIFSAIVFIVYALFIIDVFVMVQNFIFLGFDGVGFVQMVKKRNGGKSV